MARPIEAAEAALPAMTPEQLDNVTRWPLRQYTGPGEDGLLAEAVARSTWAMAQAALRAALPALREVQSYPPCAECGKQHQGPGWAMYCAGCVANAAPPAPSVREVEPVAFSARPLEWDLHESSQQWTDKHHGFCILIEPEEADAYCASWGEGDAEQFKTLEQAMAWCQRELDAWVRRYVVAAPPAPAQPAPAAPDEPGAGVVATWEDEHGRERLERRRTARELQDPRIDHLFCGFDNMIENADDEYTKGYLKAMRQEFAALAAQPTQEAPKS